MEDNQNLIKKLLFGLKSLGAKNIIITDSNNGSYAYSEDNKMYSLGVVSVDAIEKTGAGDAYTAGFLSAISKNQDLKEAMTWGAINASSVIQKIGAQEGLITKEQLNNIKDSLTNFSPQEL